MPTLVDGSSIGIAGGVGRLGERVLEVAQTLSREVESFHVRTGFLQRPQRRHVDRLSRGAERKWLTVFLLPAYTSDLTPVEGVWAHVKRSLANLAVVALDRLKALIRNRLKRLQYRPDTLDGFIAGTGLALNGPASP
ncbi:hypothetical protein GCM10010406_52490 [Streptomyces thermolineatus]|uniref:Transposase n=1 Tax=Streptomyces thermolineatus TaxID=44033 RepID=A0ABN3MVC6_9ACTN